MASLHITIGSRGSKLALWQAEWVKSALEARHSQLHCDISILKTKGDKILDVPLAKVGGKGLFVKEIEEALLDGRVDVAVHSMKDMPSDIPEGLCIGAIPIREAASDVLISKQGQKLADLPEGAVVGTSSLRRAAQIKKTRPDITIAPLRGNLDTRLKKLKTEALDAIVLAAAGVKRLGLTREISEYLDESIMLPAVGQGALCIEIRTNDPEITPLVSGLNDPDTWWVVSGERAFLHRLEGGCQVPIAGHGRLENENIHLTGLVAHVDGTRILKETITGPKREAESLGEQLADILLSQGAREILEELTAYETKS
ncbi:MAG: hydroxymethylbilane synthase [Desulfobacteraceae bacterium]|nr:hydroxymethylbilane synthase [Desulfobacteraceae bacterium]